MKAFIFSYSTNYNLGVAIIYAESKELAIEMADKSNYIWENYNILEIDLTSESKLIIATEYGFELLNN